MSASAARLNISNAICEMVAENACNSYSAGPGARFIKKLSKRAIRGCAVHDDNQRGARELADWLKAGYRIVVHLL